MNSDDIIRRRTALGLTQQQLAHAVGVNRVTLARWEIGTSVPRGLSARLLVETLTRLEGDQQRRAARRAAYAARTRQNEDGLQ